MARKKKANKQAEFERKLQELSLTQLKSHAYNYSVYIEKHFADEEKSNTKPKTFTEFVLDN